MPHSDILYSLLAQRIALKKQHCSTAPAPAQTTAPVSISTSTSLNDSTRSRGGKIKVAASSHQSI